MAPFERKYSRAEWEAVFDARFARGISYARIATMAQNGELVPGRHLEMSAYYIGERCRKEAKRRAGKVESALADKPHRDAVEIIRRRMISVADQLLADYEKTAKKAPGKADLERGRQLIRLLREASALPAQKQETPPAPGTQTNGHKTEGQSRGALMDAMRSNAPLPQNAVRSDTATPEPTPEHDAEPEQGEGTGSLTSASRTQLAA